MQDKINYDTSLGEFAVKYPRTKDLFRKFDLDYCCGGHKNMAIAVKEKEIDWDEFKNMLKKIIEETPKEEKIIDWENESLTNIIDYIEKKHHDFLWAKLASTENLFNKLIAVHVRRHGDFLVSLKDMFADFKDKLELHLLSEENNIFNYVKEMENSLKTTGKKPAENMSFTKELIETLQKDHEETGEILTNLRKFTSDYELPDYACPSFAKLYQDLDAIEDDLHDHIHLENTILFPKLKKLLEQ